MRVLFFFNAPHSLFLEGMLNDKSGIESSIHFFFTYLWSERIENTADI